MLKYNFFDYDYYSFEIIEIMSNAVEFNTVLNDKMPLLLVALHCLLRKTAKFTYNENRRFLEADFVIYFTRPTPKFTETM